MPTHVYKLKNGQRVPGVTTVLGRFKPSGGLIHWAWKLGSEGKDYRKVRDDAADAGTMAHLAIEKWKRRETMEWVGDADVVARAQKAYGAFLEWAEQTKLVVDKTEMPLVSEKYAYGGCFDAILINAKRAMGDWKSSNSVYGEMLAQLAAYGQLWNENFPDEPITGGFNLMRFDKTYGDFSHKWWGELNAGWKYFMHVREAYECDKELEARAK